MRFLLFFLYFSLMAFLFHFIWEYLQCSPYFIHLKNPPTLVSMLKATAGDMVILWSTYLLLSVFNQSLSWGLRPWKAWEGIGLVLLSSAIVEVIEFRSLQQGLWTYTPINPTVPGVGISILPLLQMGVINPLSLFLSRKFHEFRNDRHGPVR